MSAAGTAQPAGSRTWERLREAAVPSLAGAAVMAASLMNFLNHNAYPVLRLEIGMVAALLVAVVVLMGLLYALSGELVRIVLQILLLCAAIDLNFDGYVVPVAAVAIAVGLQSRAMPFLAVAASAVLVMLAAGKAVAEHGADAPPAPSEARGDLPVLVHLILDEHIGVEGLPADNPEAAKMRETLKRLYVDRGFRLFGGAFSEHIRTVNAVPQLLNFGGDHAWNPSGAAQSSLATNRYFDRLGARGYRIQVVQTDYLDYCTNRYVVRCETYRAADLAGIVDAPLSTGEKAYVVMTEFAKLSSALTIPASIYHQVFHRAQTIGLPPLAALDLLDRLAAELPAAKPGDAYFVHVLLPHSPYSLAADCSLRDLDEWKDQWNGPKQERIDGYLSQLACLNGKLEKVIEASGKNAVTILQGDHGYRIADIEPNAKTLGKFSERDLIAGHSTLFAVRAPGVLPGYETRPLPSWEILRQFATSDFHSAEISLAADFAPSIMLEDGDWKPVKRHPLPAGWPAPVKH